MTPRKKLYLAIKSKLAKIQALEYIDLQRKQFDNPKENYPTYWTAALIEIKAIVWEQMVNNRREGKCTVDIILYTKDGWADQFETSSDADFGLSEIELIDNIISEIEFLQVTDGLQPVSTFVLTNETTEDNDTEMLSYRLSFETTIYEKTELTNTKNYVFRKIRT